MSVIRVETQSSTQCCESNTGLTSQVKSNQDRPAHLWESPTCKLHGGEMILKRKLL